MRILVTNDDGIHSDGLDVCAQRHHQREVPAVGVDEVHAVAVPFDRAIGHHQGLDPDIGDIARGVRTAPFGRPTARLTTSKKAPMQRHEGGYYIRLLAVDKPGTAATIAKHISLESIVQRHRDPRPQGGSAPGRSGGPVPVILITYATTEDAMRRALAAVGRDKVISGKPQVIRIEKN